MTDQVSPTSTLYQILTGQTQQWRAQGYPHEEFPVIAEILEWAANPEGGNFRLRAPQLRALEIYWYLRLVEGTPHIYDLYQRLYQRNSERMDALGLEHSDLQQHVMDYGFNHLIESVRTDDDFVRRYRLESLRETLSLAYPSYILALAMGAGKTVLIGSIFASEFAMAQEYPEARFVQNALVFAPGKTIIESLRELVEMRYQAVLPPRMYKWFEATWKPTFTRDGDPDIPIIPGSCFNVVVTNTEKIRIQKETVLKSFVGTLFAGQNEDEAKAEVANRRLQAIASLPNLAIFSDEAHHTYGQAMDRVQKKVRKTVDYLHNPHPQGTPEYEAHQSNLICVVNTTGTPYYKRQVLRDVVVWYGLSEGIRDGILKELSGNIQAFDFEGHVETYIEHVIGDFFEAYGEATLPDGTPAKLAVFFPQTDDVAELRPLIERKLVEMGYGTDLILEHHTAHEDKAGFDHFRSSSQRVALLVSRGVEGWNVPALFACALARKLSGGRNNFVLQAASRCLRQIPGNTLPARIYLSTDNFSILDNQLQETYGETIRDLNHAGSNSRPWTITLRKQNIPPLLVKKKIRTVVRAGDLSEQMLLKLTTPRVSAGTKLTLTRYTLAEQQSSYQVLQQMGDSVEIESADRRLGLFAAAAELARNYHLEALSVYHELQRIYAGQDEIPLAHLDALAEQIEQQLCSYTVLEEEVEVALALVRPEGFTRQVDATGVETYTAEIMVPLNRLDLLAEYEKWKDKCGVFGFHYSPYNFDSGAEASFFEQMLAHLKLHPEDVEDIYFTGALTNPRQTDFFVEYKGEDERWHRYTPDFIIRRKDGKCLVVEIKSAQFRNAVEQDLQRAGSGQAAITVEGRKAVAARRWENLNPERLKYEIIFGAETIAYDEMAAAREFVEGKAEG